MLFKQALESIFSLKKPQDLYSQFARFLITGGFTAAVDFSLLVLSVELFSLHFLTAGGIAFAVGVSLNYFISRSWVFSGGRYCPSVEFLSFIITGGIGLALNQIILWGLVNKFFIDYRISKLVSIVLVTFWNFFTKRYLIFKK